MQRFNERNAPDKINVFAVIAFMALLGAGLFYAGDSFRAPQVTAQLAVPNLNP
jgi:hypothetical protein